MKKTTKVMLTLGCAAAMATSAFGLTACGTPAAEVTGRYLSNNDITWANMLPTYNYYYANIITQEIQTLSDGTYVLTINTVMFSNFHVGPDVPTGEETWNDRGQTSTKYYGTYTSVEDEGDLTLTLSAPERAVYESFGNLPIDSTVTYGDDQVVTSMGGGETTYNDYIAAVLAKFTGAEVFISGTSATFSQIEIK